MYVCERSRGYILLRYVKTQTLHPAAAQPGRYCEGPVNRNTNMETLTGNLCLYVVVPFASLKKRISKLCIHIWLFAWLSVLRASVWVLPRWCTGQYSCRSSIGCTWLRGCNSRLREPAADSLSIWTVWEGNEWRNTTKWMDSRTLCLMFVSNGSL